MSKSLAGTWTLARLILRRDRIPLLIWIVGLSLLPLGQAVGFDGLYPTAEARQDFAASTAANPVTLGILGPIFDPSLGGIVAWRVGVQSWLFAAIPSLLFVIRHTRTEEESGRRELLGATVVGRYAPLTAAVGVTLFANLLIAVLIATALSAYGLPVQGVVAFGLSVAGAGSIFVAVGAVAAQITEGAGAARSISLIVFAAFFLPKIIGDLGRTGSPLSFLSWISPLAWTRFTRPFADERWWVFALIFLFVAVVILASYVLSERRDLGSGLVSVRPGPAAAPPYFGSPLALAWRLQRGFLIGCIVAYAVFGALLGAIVRLATGLLDNSALAPWLAMMDDTANDVGEAFLVWFIYILAQLASAYVVIAVLRLRTEETEGRADTLLSAPVGRLKWAASHLIFAALGSIALLGAMGLCAGLTYGLASGDVARTLPEILSGAMVKLPAVWVVAGIAVAAYGFLLRFAAYITWGVLMVFIVLELLWETGQISDTVFGVSPFAYVHPYIGDAGVTSSFFALIAVAAVLSAAGLAGLRRRDLG